MSKKDDKKKEEHEKDDDFAAVEKKDKKEKKKDVKESAEAKAKIEATIDDDSDSEEGDIKVTRVGYVEMKAAKSWKAVYCVLIGGSLYWSKSSTVRAFPLWARRGVRSSSSVSPWTRRHRPLFCVSSIY